MGRYSPKKAQNDPKKAKSHKTKKILQNESYQSNRVNPTNLHGPHPSPQNGPIGPKKPQNDPKEQKIKM